MAATMSCRRTSTSSRRMPATPRPRRSWCSCPRTRPRPSEGPARLLESLRVVRLVVLDDLQLRPLPCGLAEVEHVRPDLQEERRLRLGEQFHRAAVGAGEKQLVAFP